MSDFEARLIDAIRQQFPNADHLGCHFHFGQAVWRKVQDVGLAVSYKEIEEIRSFVQKCIALAFIPILDVQITFNILEQALIQPHRDILKLFIGYFRTTWIAGNFQLRLWNKYG